MSKTCLQSHISKPDLIRLIVEEIALVFNLGWWQPTYKLVDTNGFNGPQISNKMYRHLHIRANSILTQNLVSYQDPKYYLFD